MSTPACLPGQLLRLARYNRELTQQAIRRFHTENGGTYGSPWIYTELNGSGFACGRANVALLMRLAGINGCPMWHVRVTSKGGPVLASNLLDQNFSADQANEHRASDITFIWIG